MHSNEDWQLTETKHLHNSNSKTEMLAFQDTVAEMVTEDFGFQDILVLCPRPPKVMGSKKW